MLPTRTVTDKQQSAHHITIVMVPESARIQRDLGGHSTTQEPHGFGHSHHQQTKSTSQGQLVSLVTLHRAAQRSIRTPQHTVQRELHLPGHPTRPATHSCKRGKFCLKHNMRSKTCRSTCREHRNNQLNKHTSNSACSTSQRKDTLMFFARAEACPNSRHAVFSKDQGRRRRAKGA